MSDGPASAWPLSGTTRPRVALATCAVATDHDMFVCVHRATMEAITSLGCDVTEVGDGDPEGLSADVLLLTLDCRHFPRYAEMLGGRRESRPHTILWQWDPLFDAETPKDVRDEALRLMTGADPAGAPRWSQHLLAGVMPGSSAQDLARRAGRHRVRRAFMAFTKRIHRGAYGEFRWDLDHRRLRKLAERDHWARTGRAAGWWDELCVSTLQKQASLAALDIDAAFVPIGLNEHLGRDLGLARDIDALFLGALSSGSPRERLVRRLQAELGDQGLRFEVVTEGCSSDRRVELLNRTRVLLHFHNLFPWDTPWIRFFTAFANGAMVVSQPLVDPRPFTPGEHYVEAEEDRLAETVVRYARDENARSRIAARAAADAASRWTTHRSLQTLLRPFACSFSNRGGI
ncbi:MAG: glycosyltransferase family protein [Planctomycetota bacterium]|jgi:hypothetical protein